MTDTNGKAYYHVVTVLSRTKGSNSTTTRVDIPEVNKTVMRIPVKLKKSTELIKGQSIAVWGLMVGEEVTDHESIEEMAKNVEWALVFKLALDKELPGCRVN